MARATPDEVLAWMAETGHGVKLAAKHFGVPLGTVKSWKLRYGDATLRGDATPSATATVSGKRPSSRSKASTRGDRQPRADGPVENARLGTTTPEQLDNLERDTLKAIELRLSRLADVDSVGAKGERDTAIALGILLDKLERIAKVRALLKGPDGQLDGDSARAREDAAQRVRAALGLDPGAGNAG